MDKGKWLCDRLDEHRWALYKNGYVVFVGSEADCIARWKAAVIAEHHTRDLQDRALVKVVGRLH